MSDKNDTFIIAVPARNYGDLATAAALHDMDISTWLSTGVNTLAHKQSSPTPDTPASTPSYRATESELLALTGHPTNN